MVPTTHVWVAILEVATKLKFDFFQVAMNKITKDLQTSTNQNYIRSGFPKEIFTKMKLQTNNKTYV
jgi:hypothetical protein